MLQMRESICSKRRIRPYVLGRKDGSGLPGRPDLHATRYSENEEGPQDSAALPSVLIITLNGGTDNERKVRGCVI